VLRDVTIAYGRRVVLAHIDADIPRGQIVSLVGPNGSGKSTLLKAISGLVPLVSGEIQLFDEPIAKQRRRLAYVPQREDVDWRFPISVLDVVLLGRLSKRGWLLPPSTDDRNVARHALAHLGIGDLADRQISELSGGQQRRAFIARALAQEPDVILLDEPMTGIDAETHDRILELFDEWRGQGKVVVQATHTHVHGGSMIVLRRRSEPIPAADIEHHAFEAGEHHGHAH
jgi:manganese/zinc/iron transport system ATP- binding protein